jgi:hypothetical protein
VHAAALLDSNKLLCYNSHAVKFIAQRALQRKQAMTTLKIINLYIICLALLNSLAVANQWLPAPKNCLLGTPSAHDTHDQSRQKI